MPRPAIEVAELQDAELIICNDNAVVLSADGALQENLSLRVRNGYLCQLADGPLVVSAQGDVGITDYSSRYARLVYFYNHNLRASLANARFVDGTAVVMCDDVRPLNYCHWIIDWLPRLAFLGDRARRRDVYVVTMPMTTDFQRETLRICGFDEDRIIELDSFQAVRARELMVPSDLHDTPHPAHKGAAWAYSYLRGTIGWRSAPTSTAAAPPARKLYISRADAEGRRILNEDALFAVLSRAGYTRITLSGMTVSEQIAAFAGASHVVAPHGAGLANFAFAAPGAQLVEIFPRTYGTAAFYVLAAAQENPYASYVGEVVAPGHNSQYDDVTVDVDDFARCCAAFL
jgi:capsular polysaccharide biosynthesis protein